MALATFALTIGLSFITLSVSAASACKGLERGPCEKRVDSKSKSSKSGDKKRFESKRESGDKKKSESKKKKSEKTSKKKSEKTI